MVDLCAYCNGCSSTQQLSFYPRYSFPKKLLVAISIVVIITMCLVPTEARRLEHKKKYKRPDNLPHPTKDISLKTFNHRIRHQGLRRPRNSQTDIYYNETKKIVTKLKNTRRFFNEDKKKLSLDELKEYKNAIPSWLPTVNFVEIHYHDYRSNRSRKNGSTIPERKYMYIMPKLYKSLVEYEEIFKHLLNVELDFPDDPFQTYKKKRRHVLQNTLYKLFSTIQEVNDSMAAVNMSIPTFNKNKPDLSSLEKKVDATQCIKNDYIAFRGYGNLLNNWFFEFKCPRGKQLERKICQKYTEKLALRLNSRRDKITNSSLLSRLNET